MELKLTVYTDESMTEVKDVRTADTVKIPYRVATSVISSLDSVDLDDEDSIIKYIACNVDKMDKILKATFGVSEAELDCINVTELVDSVKEIYTWAVGQVRTIKTKEAVKNAMAAM